MSVTHWGPTSCPFVHFVVGISSRVVRCGLSHLHWAESVQIRVNPCPRSSLWPLGLRGAKVEWLRTGVRSGIVLGVVAVGGR